MRMRDAGKLYIVPTPIGNLDDMTFRAVTVLKSVDRLLTEDTRRTRILCTRYAISTPLERFDDHVAQRRLPQLLNDLENGRNLALVSDAGVPTISDPGTPLVRAATVRNIPLEVLPGASAVITALAGSGFPCGRFVFEGFLPRKGKSRRLCLERIARESATVVLYESPRRLADTLTDLEAAGEEREAVVARELTKRFETWHRGTVSQLAAAFRNNPPRGEIVLVLHGLSTPTPTREQARQQLEAALTAGLSLKEAARQVASKTGFSGSNLYKMALDLTKKPF